MVSRKTSAVACGPTTGVNANAATVTAPTAPNALRYCGADESRRSRRCAPRLLLSPGSPGNAARKDSLVTIPSYFRPRQIQHFFSRMQRSAADFTTLAKGLKCNETRSYRLRDEDE